jgi:hypothetical protein
MAGNGAIQRAAKLRKFALASDEPLTRLMTLAFSRPQDAYRRAPDFLLGQIAIPPKVSTLSYQNGGRAENRRSSAPAILAFWRLRHSASFSAPD